MQDYQQQPQQEKAGIITVASDLAMVAAILLVQHLSVSSLVISATDTITLSEEQFAAFRSAALPTFAIIMIAVGISLVGIRQMLSSWKSAKIEGTIFHTTKISIADALHKQNTAFWLALSLYSIIFLFASRVSENRDANGAITALQLAIKMRMVTCLMQLIQMRTGLIEKVFQQHYQLLLSM